MFGIGLVITGSTFIIVGFLWIAAAHVAAAIDRNTSVLEEATRQLRWIEKNTRIRT